MLAIFTIAELGSVFEDEALVSTALALAQARIYKGALEPADCVKPLQQAYTVQGAKGKYIAEIVVDGGDKDAVKS
jgi:hypothetical protein